LKKWVGKPFDVIDHRHVVILLLQDALHTPHQAHSRVIAARVRDKIGLGCNCGC